MIHVRLQLPSPALNAGLRALLSAEPEIILQEDLTDAARENGGNEADVLITTAASFLARPDRRSIPSPHSAILLLTDDPVQLQPLMNLEAPWGVLPLDTSAEELCASVRALAAGLIVGARPVLTLSDEPRAAASPLSEREIEVLRLLAKGLANKQIALELGISEHTVKFHVSSIYTKLNAANRTQAVREGLRNGWIVI